MQLSIQLYGPSIDEAPRVVIDFLDDDHLNQVDEVPRDTKISTIDEVRGDISTTDEMLGDI